MTSDTRWLDAAQQHAWRAYLRMQGELNARLARDMQSSSELSMADFAVLVQLTDVPDGRVRVLELARNLHWEKSRISHHIGRMEKRGLVRRENCRSDGRGAFVVLTDAGRAAIEAAAPRHVEQVRALMFDHLSEEEVAVLARISERVIGKLTAVPDPECS
ncbi:MarR family transcriptional regulator [Lentzea sp. NBRC 105346]|uniref:MarR family winged helix-turn-helix transcriptional regulator n=1 Tax=Lentzea sp. NBRC 105346 TaxID=3032205 RepID=UPI0024A2E724|nr:MarR family transcriptional regulator [Lentzea sp. NBRC 105346]GLZ31692.1 MarR family transcriptional regulator [Lentzea sp. NBRC 105346]